MNRKWSVGAGWVFGATLAVFNPVFAQDAPLQVAGELSETSFADPPPSAGIRCWWWWLNGNVTKESITRDLEAMKEKGFSGACIFDAGGQNQRGNGNEIGRASCRERVCQYV